MPNSASVGAFFGKTCAIFTAAGQDTGAIGFNEVPPYYKDRNFQLVGSGTGYSVQLFGTFDQNTATGVPGASEWFPLPASLNGTANPMTSAASRFYHYTGSLAAVRAVASADNPSTPSGTILLLIYTAA